MKLQKIIAEILLTSVMLYNAVGLVRAYEIPSAPTAPSAPSAPTAPTAPTAPSAPSAPSAPTAPSAPSFHDSPTPTPEPSPIPNATPTDAPKEETSQPPGDTTTQNTQSPVPSAQTGQQTGNQTQNGTSDPAITTGDATNTASAIAIGNNNSTSQPVVSDGSGSGVTIGNTNNGANSTNTGALVSDATSVTVQDNQATVGNTLDQVSVTGQNTASKNVGSTTITTGDANTSGTIITAVNTNVDGIAVSEFNIADDHVGDIILDFATGCTIGCQNGDTTILNKGNGTGSTNTGALDSTTNDLSFQNNDADIVNSMTLGADSGNNTADKNTGGDTNITTGDANVSASSLTFANNNIEGNVIYGIVNIYGDLTGDIIFPEELFGSVCCPSTNNTVKNIGNGSGSTNSGTIAQTTNDESFQTNNAAIDSTLILDADSGGNSTSKNTGGNTNIETGNTSVTAQVVNVANANLDNANWWLVLVNEAGNWVGQIFGADPNSNYAGAPGTEFSVNDAGEISVANIGNGSDSTNTGTVNQTSNTTTVQNNDAVITNTLNLSANTGGNKANKNTGGNESIKTGDATIIANVVNFVNNNIIGNGKLYVTVVNVFGSWLGDFVGPGQKKAPKETQLAQQSNPPPPPPAIGGTSVNPSVQSNPTNETNLSNASTQPTPTPTTSSVAAAFGTGSPYGFNTLVLGASSESTGGNQSGTVTKSNKAIPINLAWLILLIPCAIVFFAVRKLARKFLHRHTPANR